MARQRKKPAKKVTPPPPAPVAKWYQLPPVLAGLLFAFSFLLYANTLGHDFALDDGIVITDNALVQRGVSAWGDILSHDTFYGFFQDESKARMVSGGRYRPLTLLLFTLERAVSTTPFIHHLFNLIWYGGAVVLFYILILRFVRHRHGPEPGAWGWLPLVAALLFAAHPLHTEVVANIKGRDEILALLGGLGATWFVWSAVDRDDWGRALAAAGVFFLGLLAKENTITFLAVIPLTLFALRRDFSRAQLRFLVPLFLATGVFLLIRYSVLGPDPGNAITEVMNNPFLKWTGNTWVPFTFGEWSATVVYGLGKYLQLLLFPLQLSHDYYPRALGVMQWSDWRVILALIVNVGLLIYGFVQLRRKPWIAVGILAYFLTLSVVSNVFFPVGTHLSERFLFMPSVGFALLSAWVTLRFLGPADFRTDTGREVDSLTAIPAEERSGSSVVSWRKPLGYAPLSRTLLVFLLAILGLYSARTVSRNPVWADNFSLFTTDVEVTPNSAKLQNAAGGVKIDRYLSFPEANRAAYTSLLTEAVDHLNRALAIHPTYKNAYLLRGNARFLLKQYDEAVADYDRALTFDPGYEDANTNLRVALQRGGLYFGRELGQLDKARQYFERALALVPNDYETLRNLGFLYGVSGNHAEAIEYFQAAARVNPNVADIWWDLGTAYYQGGQIELANAQFDRARKLEPGIDARKRNE